MKMIYLIIIIAFFSIILVGSFLFLHNPLLSNSNSISQQTQDSILSQAQGENPLGDISISYQPTLTLKKNQGLEKYLIQDKEWSFDSTNLYINITINQSVYNFMKSAVDNPTMAKCQKAEPYIQEDFPTFTCSNANHRDLLLSKLQNFTSKGFKLIKRGINQGYINKSGNEIYITIPRNALLNRDLLEIGENSLDYIYQNESKIQYITDWGASSNVTLLENDTDGNFTLNVENIWLRSTEGKFGANHTNLTINETRIFIYRVESTSEIVNDGSLAPYVRRFTTSNRQRTEEKHHFDFTDICTRKFGEFFNVTSNQTEYEHEADCSFNYYTQPFPLENASEGNSTHYFLDVTFRSDEFIDPTISVSEFRTSESIDVNVNQENNFSHLSISSTSPYDSLVLYMPFDVNHSQKDNITYDYSGYDNDGTVINATVNNSGMLGSAMTFNGDAAVLMPNSDIDDSNPISLNESFAIALWVNFAQSKSTYVINNFQGVAASYVGNSILLHADPSGSDVQIKGHIDDNSNPTQWNGAVLNLNQWYHVVMIRYKGDNASFYVDGVFDSSTSDVTTKNVLSDLPWIIGARLDGGTEIPGAEFFNGSIDEVMIFNTSLNATEILDIYNNQSLRFNGGGTQTLKQFNMTHATGNNTINVTTDNIQEVFGSQMELRLGEWDVSRGYNDSVDGTVTSGDGTGLVVYYHFDNESDQLENETHVFDWSGNSLNGSPSNQAKPTDSGYYDGAFDFDGSNDFVELSGVDPYTTNSEEVTLIAWIKNDDTSTGVNRDIIGESNMRMNWRSTSNLLSCTLDTSGSTAKFADSDVAYTNLDWHMIACRYNTTTLTIWIDAVENFADLEELSGNIDTVGDIDIGDDFDGTIDEVMIWNRSLSADEIKDLYIKGRAKWNYLGYQNVTQDVQNNFTISTATTNILPEYRFTANGSNSTTQFYSPILEAGMTFDFFTIAEGNQAPVSILSQPANNSNYSGGSIVTFEVNATDDRNLDNVTLYVYNPDDTLNHTNFTNWNGTSNTTTFTFNFTGDGIYLWNALVFDNGTLSDWAVNRTLNISTAGVVDNINPNVTINQPLNQTYTTTTIDFNVTALDETAINRVRYSINGGDDNFTMTNNSGSPNDFNATNTTMSQGSHTVTYYANDSSNNLNNSETVTFFIDTLLDTISYVTPTETDDTYQSRNNISINITATDNGAGLQNITLRLYNGSNSFVANFTSTTSPAFANFTSLADGQYYFNGTATDTLNNINLSLSTRNVTIDTTNPDLNITFPTVNNTNQTDNTIDINFTRSDTNLASCWYSNDTYLVNITLASCANITTVVWSNALHNLTIWINDSAGNINQSSISFNISGVADTTNPNVTINQPLNQSYTTTTINFNVTAEDETSMSDVYYTLNDGADNFTMANLSTSPSEWTAQNTTMSQGSHTVTYYANDTSNNLNDSESVTFFIDSRFDNISYVTPTETNNSIISRNNIRVNVTAEDLGVGLANISVRLYNSVHVLLNTINGTSSPLFANFTNGTGLSDGDYYFNATGMDLLLNTNSTSTRKVTIDTTFPDINITTPQNNSESENTLLDVNYTRSDANLDSCWYTNDSNSVNTTLASCTNLTTIVWTVGNHNVTIYANDSAGNVNASRVTFNITEADVINPDLDIVYPATNNTNHTDTGIDINYTRSDETGLDSCFYSNDTYDVNTTLASCVNITTVTWSEGNHNLTIWVNDTSNNFNQSSISFRIDTTAPTLSFTNQTMNDNESLFHNINATDDGVGVADFSIDDTTNFTINNTGGLINATGLSIANYTVNVSVNDTLGNTFSDLINIEVQNSTTENVAPTFDNLINHSSLANGSFSYDLDATDSDGIDTFTLNDTTKFNITSTGIIRNATNLSDIKIYHLNVTVNDTTGLQTSGVFFINVTLLVPPVITGLTTDDMILGYDIDPSLAYQNENDIRVGYRR